ncbi:hypothetical protein FACS189485_02500 [Spirochaetia bacterium]|nr:hypothetical protein FACS189485_02500 [Spirochaetia bacterium]
MKKNGTWHLYAILFGLILSFGFMCISCETTPNTQTSTSSTEQVKNLENDSVTTTNIPDAEIFMGMSLEQLKEYVSPLEVIQEGSPDMYTVRKYPNDDLTSGFSLDPNTGGYVWQIFSFNSLEHATSLLGIMNERYGRYSKGDEFGTDGVLWFPPSTSKIELVKLQVFPNNGTTVVILSFLGKDRPNE